MLYILDAYNIICKLKKRHSWGDLRRGFLRFLHRHPISWSKKNRIIVVFDGQRNPDIIFKFPSFEIVFSGNDTADKKIEKILARMRPSAGIVVSDDREVAFYARKAGVSSLKVDEFISLMRKEDSETVSEDKDGLGKEDVEEINEELYRLWVKRGS